MIVPFFDLNPYVLRELRAMDHDAKEYRRYLHKILMEIGGIKILLNYLKMSDEGAHLRRNYLRNIVILSAMIVVIFGNIAAAVIITGGREISQFSSSDRTIFAVFIISTALMIIFMLILAIRTGKILLQGVSHIIGSYELQPCNSTNSRLSDYPFPVWKKNNTNLIVGILAFVGSVILFASISVFDIDELPIFEPRPQDFSKAGLTITLNKDFYEDNVVTQTATYCSQKHLVLCFKEEFHILEELGFDTDITLWEYAESVAENNSTGVNVMGEESRPYLIYEDHISGKDFKYFTSVYKGKDAFWTVTFVCEEFDFDDSLDKFQKWADTVILD